MHNLRGEAPPIPFFSLERWRSLNLTLYAGVGGGGDPPLDLAKFLLKLSAFKAICASKYLLKAMQVCLTV